jgi:hypothetical protein
MPFRTVSGEEAGPDAVGILVPPSPRTVVVVRPRRLDFDLLLVRRGPDGDLLPGFHEAGRGEASMLAQNLGKALGGKSSVEVVSTDGGGFWVRAEVGAFPLIVCGRVPGQPYRPLAFPDEAAASQAADAVRYVLCPGPDTESQLYFNTQNFAR